VDYPRCGGRRKPNIVYFAENVPKSHVEQAYSIFDGAEATSLSVFSAYRSVRCAAAHDIAIANKGRTRGDGLATVKVDGGCSPIVALLADDAALELIDEARPQPLPSRAPPVRCSCRCFGPVALRGYRAAPGQV
jgi:NAD-dependent SIR2 family protein deacetylase